ncbi:MAG: hypothetical protein JWP90_1775 [Mycetocola sp.]|nr:hypothetical protein [Mycetocola sp.]
MNAVSTAKWPELPNRRLGSLNRPRARRSNVAGWPLSSSPATSSSPERSRRGRCRSAPPPVRCSRPLKDCRGGPSAQHRRTDHRPCLRGSRRRRCGSPGACGRDRSSDCARAARQGAHRVRQPVRCRGEQLGRRAAFDLGLVGTVRDLAAVLLPLIDRKTDHPADDQCGAGEGNSPSTRSAPSCRGVEKNSSTWRTRTSCAGCSTDQQRWRGCQWERYGARTTSTRWNSLMSE